MTIKQIFGHADGALAGTSKTMPTSNANDFVPGQSTSPAEEARLPHQDNSPCLAPQPTIIYQRQPYQQQQFTSENRREDRGSEFYRQQMQQHQVDPLPNQDPRVDQLVHAVGERFGSEPRGRTPIYRKPYPDYIDTIPSPHGFRIPDSTKFTGDSSKSTLEHIGQFVAVWGSRQQ